MIEALLREGRNPAEAVSLWLRFRSALTQSSELPVQDPTPPAVLAVYVVLSDRIASWMIEPSGVTFRWLAAKPSEIARQSNKLLEVASDPSSDAPSIEALGRSLYNGLMAPFGAILADNRDIAILADAGLSTIPFHLLVTPSGQFLGEQMPITVHLTFGAVRHEQPLSASDDALIAANSRVSNLLPVAQTRLADAEQEGTSVAERFRHAVLLSDTDATLTGLARYGPGAEIFHFSGHGFSNRGNGALVLADSLYTSRQIMIADWRRCRLAVLSACLTAAGELRGPSNPESLVHAFLLAGVHNVVATQWKIDSRASRSFMNAFYNSLFAGEQPAAALQTARRSLHSIPEFRHPYYWGAFQIYQ
jgi:CHAT domain-containing protein